MPGESWNPIAAAFIIAVYWSALSLPELKALLPGASASFQISQASA
ncbi:MULTISPECIES: hypothetical protein [unclassified Streptomyces]|nr:MULTISPECIES: hypothetical protein [unclassified Streptomyces]MYQ86975.1 hypothetical protein [Streptomyces sp. SID4936]